MRSTLVDLFWVVFNYEAMAPWSSMVYFQIFYRYFQIDMVYLRETPLSILVVRQDIERFGLGWFVPDIILGLRGMEAKFDTIFGPSLQNHDTTRW
jgi:hypothetical protein